MIFVSISDPEIDKCIGLVDKYKNVELRLDLIKPEIDDIGLMISKSRKFDLYIQRYFRSAEGLRLHDKSARTRS